MRWYINDSSLQGQFSRQSFEDALREILGARRRVEVLRQNLRIGRNVTTCRVTTSEELRYVVSNLPDKDLRVGTLTWLDRSGPFIDDERFPESDDYFEFQGVDVTDGGLGEATRRAKAGHDVAAFSFCGGAINFAVSPLIVQHGLTDSPIGSHSVSNIWAVTDLKNSALAAIPLANSWVSLVGFARASFSHLRIPDSVHLNSALAREPFDAVIRDRAFELLRQLNRYMAGREENGAEGADARDVIQNFFTGDRALFSGESDTNKKLFCTQMTFADPDSPGQHIFAHWHGKISHKYFRLHFQWPVPRGAKHLNILYLGPKLTKG